MKDVKVISGGIAADERGQIRFINQFDMTLVKRFYIIKNKDIELVRGWRAHKIEQRWFYVLSGSFMLSLVKIDNWENPDSNLTIERKLLQAVDNEVINIPPGFGTAFKALEPESELLVFADYPISHAALDDHTWQLSQFKNFNSF